MERKAAANDLQISYKALLYKIKQYDLSPRNHARSVEERRQRSSQIAYRIVIRYERSCCPGLCGARELGTIEQLLRNDPLYPLDSIRLKLLETGEMEEVSTKDAKAVFFVKTFDGDLRHRALHFHEHAPIVTGLVGAGVLSRRRDD